MADEIQAGDRVEHIADRNRDVPRLGSVELLYWDPAGTAYARVRWDSEVTPVGHPVANLKKA